MTEFKKIIANNNSIGQRKPIHGVGINDAWYQVQHMIGIKTIICPFYRKWKSMITRCYSEKHQQSRPNYAECYVCDEWLIFSNFKAWMKKQDWQDKELDKDILNQGNNIYSPIDCLFVSQAVNSLILDSAASRGIYPQGVCLFKRDGSFQAELRVNGKKKYLGRFSTPEIASKAYKSAKYKLLADIAELHSEPLRTALLNYTIK